MSWSTHKDGVWFYENSAACANVVVVAVDADNYSYIFIDSESKSGVCVDPREPQKVLAAATAFGLTLKFSLTTHKHRDHSGGNEELSKLQGSEFKVYGPATETDCPGATHKLQPNDTLSHGDLLIRAIHTPCHTAGHFVYHVTSSKDAPTADLLFTGDTLFVGGCGRFFEGTAEQMCSSLKTIRTSVPPSALVFCGHEYTVNNLRFARTVEPDSAALKEKETWSLAQRASGLPTVPSTLAGECEFNPFMRVEEDCLQKLLGGTAGRMNAVQTMAELRRLKNAF